jgi:hypothetical protein
MFILSFLEIPKGVLKRLIFIDRDSFGKEMKQNENIDQRNGTSYVGRKIKVALALRF